MGDVDEGLVECSRLIGERGRRYGGAQRRGTHLEPVEAATIASRIGTERGASVDGDGTANAADAATVAESVDGECEGWCVGAGVCVWMGCTHSAVFPASIVAPMWREDCWAEMAPLVQCNGLE